MSSHRKTIPTTAPEAIFEELDRVLSSVVFRRSDRSSKLLRYLVEQTFAGQAARLKEYTLGIEALGKGSSFDPRLDPSVRLEVSRLRSRLDRYYAIEGADDPIGIVLPKGSYAPQFETRRIIAVSTSAADKERLSRWHALGLSWTKSASGLAALGVVLMAMAVGVLSDRGFAPSKGVVTERAAAASDASAVSIAVLPFLNLSGDANQEFFSDGMTEEITTALAKIPDLKLVARTSAFRFKGQNQDIQSIGQQLHATHLIEGSVRKDGTRVRITAQLIDASNGVRLRTESHDRELSDIFVTQEEIARNVVTALMAPLGLKPGENLVNNRSTDLDSYQQYLRARALYRARAIGESIKLLELVVARDPGFAPAWAQLARSYDFLPIFSPVMRSDPIDEARRSVAATLTKAELAAREALRLDARYAGGYAALADVKFLTGRFSEAEDLFRKALALDANDPDVLNRYSAMLNVEGRLKESLAVAEQIRMLEPFVPGYQRNLAGIMQDNGQIRASIPILESIPTDSAVGYYRNVYLARAYAAAGDYAKSADTLLAIAGNLVSRRSVEEAARLIRTAPTKAKTPNGLPVLEGELSFVYAYVGALDRVLEFPERAGAIGFSGQAALDSAWYPPFAPIRKTERFKEFARHLGLVEYWRVKGWPQWCHPAAGDDFECN